ncbi:MAG: hypothetical protein WC544_01790 [Patescibacteria group bacterium]
MFDLSATWIKLNYFVLTNRQQLKKWWVLILLAVTIFGVVFVITNIVIYIVSLPRQNALVAAMADSQVDYAGLRIQTKPLALNVNEARALPVSAGRYDLVAKVVNSNKNWAATAVTYSFTVDGESTGEQTESVMPGSEQYLIAFNVSGPESASSVDASLSLAHVTWQRVPDTSLLPQQNFTFSQVTHEPSTTLTGQRTYRVTAQVTNNAFIGFWKAKFIVVLYNGGQIVGVNTVFLEKMLAGDTKSLYTQWDNLSASVTSVSIVPSVNLLDSANLIR